MYTYIYIYIYTYIYIYIYIHTYTYTYTYTHTHTYTLHDVYDDQGAVCEARGHGDLHIVIIIIINITIMNYYDCYYDT